MDQSRSYEDDQQYQPDPELEAVMDDFADTDDLLTSIEMEDAALDEWADRMAAEQGL